tara:strand:+ start:2259 stop:2633 length:375 start_codon:yes stop_codon:yes gene_type:complete
LVKTIVLIFLSFFLSANCRIELKNIAQENFVISANDLNNIDFSSPETISDDIYNTLVLFLGENAFIFDRSILEKNVKAILESEFGIGKSHDSQDFSSDESKLNFLNQVSLSYGLSFKLVKIRLQ